jgi:hypothetical protein
MKTEELLQALYKISLENNKMLKTLLEDDTITLIKESSHMLKTLFEEDIVVKTAQENNKLLKTLIEDGVKVKDGKTEGSSKEDMKLGKDLEPKVVTGDKIIDKSDYVTGWTDEETGLTWEFKSEDRRNTILTFKEAEEYRDELNSTKFSGFDDWRIPTLKELKTLITKDKNLFSFIKAPLAKNTNYGYWTSTKYDANFFMIVNFRAGKETKSEKNNLDYIRCVRGQIEE